MPHADGAPAPRFEVKVDSIDPVADGVVELVLVDPHGRPLRAWEPGAHLDLHLPNGLIRQYSLTSDPADRGAYRVAGQIRESGGEALALSCDLGDVDSVETAVTRAAEWAGGIDLLAVVGAMAHVGEVEKISPSDFRRVLDVNLVWPFTAARAALPHLIAAKGNIVNVASLAGIKGMPYGAAYSASKGGLLMLTKSLSVELWETGVRVNAVAPGGVSTGMPAAGEYPEGGWERVAKRFRTSFGPATAEQVAEAVVFLGSAEAHMINGVVLPVDGGASA